MEFEVYCDEANPDVLTSREPRARYLMIGSVWIPSNFRDELKTGIDRLRERHQTWGEIKWTKVSPSKLDFYIELINLFMSFGKNVRFRCIAVDHSQVNLQFHNNDGELGFYKFYYQMLHHWILDFNKYSIYCDGKCNRDLQRLPVLATCLSRANISSRVERVQSLPSREVVLIQLCDLLLGAASSRINGTLGRNTAKAVLVEHLETALGGALRPTPKGEEKFNIFKIRLQGGW
jgi:hypothetical protein